MINRTVLHASLITCVWFGRHALRIHAQGRATPCAVCIVAVRSAKGRSFAERKTTLYRTGRLGQNAPGVPPSIATPAVAGCGFSDSHSAEGSSARAFGPVAGGHGNGELLLQRLGDSVEHRTGMPRVVRVFQSADDRLRGPHQLGQFALREASLESQIVNQPGDLSIDAFLFEGCLSFGIV